MMLLITDVFQGVKLTFELPVVDAGPPAGSVPDPVQPLMQLHDAKLVLLVSQSLLNQQQPGASAHRTPAVMPAPGHRRFQRSLSG